MMVSISEIQNKTGVCFGTSGVRGLVSELTDTVCKSYTLAFIQHLKIKPEQSIALGMDLRPSSPRIAKACMEAILDCSCHVDFCGNIPTPALALYAKHKNIAAIMITGSHIPYDRNGIKFYSSKGEINKNDEKAIANAIVELKNHVLVDSFPRVNPEAFSFYKKRYLSLFSSNHFFGWRVGVYQHSSVARDCLVEVLGALGAETIPIDRTNKFVPIDTEAVNKEDTARATNWVKHYQLNALVTTDGDADRALVADETGKWLSGDIIGMLTAKYLNASSVVVPISCNTGIQLSGYFDKVLYTKIGSPYVLEGMASLGNIEPLAGFEANGGFISGIGLNVRGNILDELLTRDALLPILCVLAMASEMNTTISDLLQTLPKRFTASGRLQNISSVKSKEFLTYIENHAEFLSKIDERLSHVVSINQQDGIRMSFNNDIVHFRASGNAPELRCYIESTGFERCHLLLHKILTATLNFINHAHKNKQLVDNTPK